MATKKSTRRPVVAPSPRKAPDRPRPRRRMWVGAVALSVLGAALAVTLGLSGQRSAAAEPAAPPISPVSMAVVETVDGQVLPVREYELFLAQDRAATFAYFQQHYGLADSAGFWTTSRGGETPTGHLEKAALADATKALVQQTLATKYGVISGFTYGGFLTAWQQQNASRASALAAHQVVYGPTSYSESDYFTYTAEQTAEQLQTTLAKKGVISTTDADLEAYYNAHRSQFTDSKSDDQQIGSKVVGPQVSPTIVAFPQAKSVVEQYYVQAAYQQLVAEQTSRAVVHVDQSVLAAITIS